MSSNKIMALSSITIEEPGADRVPELGRFIWTCWEEAGPKALGWIGASDEIIQDLASGKNLSKLLSDPNLKMFLAVEDGGALGLQQTEKSALKKLSSPA